MNKNEFVEVAKVNSDTVTISNDSIP